MASIEAIRNEVDDEVSADSNVLKLRSERAFSEKSYLFSQLRYADDEFSGYDSQAALSLGAGSRFVENEAICSTPLSVWVIAASRKAIAEIPRKTPSSPPIFVTNTRSANRRL